MTAMVPSWHYAQIPSSQKDRNMSDSNSEDASGLRERLEAQGVEYALAGYVDMHGVSKSKVVPIAHLDRMMAGSELCTGAALDGVPQDVSEEEVSPRPDSQSMMILPWKRNVAWFASDLWCAGQPFEPCNRTIFKRVLAQAADMGYRFNFGIEPEFFLLRETADGYVPIGPRDDLAKPAYDVRSTLDSFDMLEHIVRELNGLGYDVYSYDHEDGNGQFEIDFTYSDGLTMADRFVFFRLLVNELAHEHGYFASFMPKPFSDRAGSGAHYNMSLADVDSGKNLFESLDDPRGLNLSPIAYQFIAGILKHLPALSAVVAPTVNSYKRLIKEGSMSGFTWAPVFACYGNNNRTNTVRVPGTTPRVELRSADISNNPYLGGAMVLAAGLEGITEGLDPGEPHLENMYLKTEEELKALGVNHLPRTLEQAIDALDADPLGRQVMGDAMFDAYIQFKRSEWESYHNHVSDWEVARYAKFF
jgi:glutamine synthetase